MKGRVVLLDQVQGRAVAALMVDGHLADILVDPPEDAGPMPGAWRPCPITATAGAKS